MHHPFFDSLFCNMESIIRLYIHHSLFIRFISSHQVERTVREVLPTVKEHRGNVRRKTLFALRPSLTILIKFLSRSHCCVLGTIEFAA